MLIYALVALLNGAVIGINRSMNGRLSLDVGPFKASLWNHAVGFLFLSTLILFNGHGFEIPLEAPISTYFGGFLGALFVSVVSYVLPRIGTMKSALLVISGQMITGVLIDFQIKNAMALLAQFAGIAMIVLGVYLSKRESDG